MVHLILSADLETDQEISASQRLAAAILLALQGAGALLRCSYLERCLSGRKGRFAKPSISL